MVDLGLADMLPTRAFSNRPPLWTMLFGVSAALFLLGAMSFAVAGAWHTALAGVACALAAVLVIVLFSGEDRPPLP